MSNYREQLDELSRMLVEVQLKLDVFQKEQEKNAFDDMQSPADGTLEYLPGPAQELKFVVDIFPPKVRVHPELLYAKNKQGPSTYSEVRDQWFTTLKNLLLQNRDKLTGLQTFPRAIAWFTFYFPDQKVRDVDNFSVKLINDALVKCRILEDDDHRVLSVVVTAAVDEQNPRTEIVIASDQGQLYKVRPRLSKS